MQTSLGIGYAPTADDSDLAFYPFGVWAPTAPLGFGLHVALRFASDDVS